MYAYITGILTHKEPALVVVENHGTGFEIRTPLHVFSELQLNEACKIYTYLHIKDDSHTLYGFTDPQEKQLFLLLIGVSGVGTGTAITLLSSLPVMELSEAIAREDVRTIQAVKGIGAKTAQRLILELKDKVKRVAGGTESTGSSSKVLSAITVAAGVQQEALQALLTLGFARAVAEKSIESIVKKHGNDISLEELIKLVLKSG